MELFSLREIARRLDLPEATVRAYRERYAAHVPTIGRGRERRYPTAALAVLAQIAQAARAGTPPEAIAHALAAQPTQADAPAQLDADGAAQRNAAPLRIATQQEAVRTLVHEAVRDAVAPEFAGLRETQAQQISMLQAEVL